MEGSQFIKKWNLKKVYKTINKYGLGSQFIYMNKY